MLLPFTWYIRLVNSMNVIFLEYPYRFQRRLPPQTEVNEGGRVEFEVQVQEEEAEVHWFSDDVEIHPEKSRQDQTGFSTSEQHLFSCLGLVVLLLILHSPGRQKSRPIRRARREAWSFGSAKWTIQRGSWLEQMSTSLRRFLWSNVSRQKIYI